MQLSVELAQFLTTAASEALSVARGPAWATAMLVAVTAAAIATTTTI
jgi:hypothetical protein